MTIAALRERHPAWRLLRAGNSTLILSFLGAFFVEGNRGACPASELAAALDDHLHALKTEVPTDNGEPRYPKEPRAYLDDWAGTDAAYLRRFYPPGDDEVHYEVTPAFEKAYAWVTALKGRSFVGTESRLHTVVELLRQIVHGTEVEPDVRLAELRRRRAELDDEIAAVEAGVVTVLDAMGVRDRYQQNEISYLSVDVPSDGCVIWGRGFDVDSAGRLPWLADAEVLYWGDIDTRGFAILDRLRAWFPQARSVLMDRETLLAHRDRWVTEDRPARSALSRLTAEERELYAELVGDVLGERVRLAGTG